MKDTALSSVLGNRDVPFRSTGQVGKVVHGRKEMLICAGMAGLIAAVTLVRSQRERAAGRSREAGLWFFVSVLFGSGAVYFVLMNGRFP